MNGLNKRVLTTGKIILIQQLFKKLKIQFSKRYQMKIYLNYIVIHPQL